MSSLQQQLLSIEDDFLKALGEGGDTLCIFEERWQKLLVDVEAALDSGSLDEETSALAHTTALRVATLADASAELFASRDEITLDLMAQVDTLMAQVSVSDESTPSLPVRHIESEVMSSRKRRRDSSESPAPYAHSNDRSKRRRCRSKKLNDQCTSPLSLPQHPISRSHDNVLASFEYCPSSLSRSRHSPAPSSLSTDSPSDGTNNPRKRRASDTDLSCLSRQSKRMYMGPRVHAVSDTFSAVVTQACTTRAQPSIGADSAAPLFLLPPQVQVYDMCSYPVDDAAFDDVVAPIGSSTSVPPASNPSDLDLLDDLLKSLLEHGVRPTAPTPPYIVGESLSPETTEDLSSPTCISTTPSSTSSCSSPSVCADSLPPTPLQCPTLRSASLPCLAAVDFPTLTGEDTYSSITAHRWTASRHATIPASVVDHDDHTSGVGLDVHPLLDFLKSPPPPPFMCPPLSASLLDFDESSFIDLTPSALTMPAVNYDQPEDSLLQGGDMGLVSGRCIDGLIA
ncbi:hypothetical protein C8T65DRAFT_127355 [Cerioporus squamosus]|nr:hypothetical protein C8T65DRAFT_127355 [Cerioporus squamosus]